jgi:hypothetical protein
MRTPRHLVPMRFKEDDLRAFLDAAKKIGKVTRMDSRDTAKRSLSNVGLIIAFVALVILCIAASLQLSG